MPHGITKFRSILIKSYFIDSIFIKDQQSISNSSTLTQKTTSVKVFQIEVPLADILSIEIFLVEIFLAFLALLSFLDRVKKRRGQPRKHLEKANFAVLLDICFLIDELNVFIKNTDMPPAQYTASRQKKIAGLLEKDIFKVVTSADILSNTQIFNSRYINKIKYVGIDKAYEKSKLVV